MILTTLEGINSTNYDQPGFYYKLFNNNNKITVICQTTGLQNDNYIELSMNGIIWLKETTISARDSFYNYEGIAAIRINPSFQSGDFLMQISEGAHPVIYRERG